MWDCLWFFGFVFFRLLHGSCFSSAESVFCLSHFLLLLFVSAFGNLLLCRLFLFLLLRPIRGRPSGSFFQDTRLPLLFLISASKRDALTFSFLFETASLLLFMLLLSTIHFIYKFVSSRCLHRFKPSRIYLYIGITSCAYKISQEISFFNMEYCTNPRKCTC